MKRYRHLLSIAAALLFIGAGLLFLWQTGFFNARSLSEMQAYIDHFSPYSQAAFFLVQLAGVILAPIPSNITAAAGALLFGMWQSFLLTIAAVILGSITVFWLARVLGQRFASQFVSDKISDRYLEVIRQKRDIFLLLVFLFPFFPDDLICILAGLTDISYLRFLAIVSIARPWGLLVACAIGSSVISIPLWGMVLIGICGISLFVLGLQYGDRIEGWLLARFKR